MHAKAKTLADYKVAQPYGLLEHDGYHSQEPGGVKHTVLKYQSIVLRVTT